MANLIVCADGTWMTAEDADERGTRVSNVVKIFGALAREDLGGEEQKSYYHPGVGTGGGRIGNLLGGGIGSGLDRNIMSAYKWLATTYRGGDRIYLFGFSRGAYTVRSLAGMITGYGMLDLTDPDLPSELVWGRIERLFQAYRAGQGADFLPTEFSFCNCDAGQPKRGTTPVHFLGVWDTVGALGIPDDLALLNLIDDPQEHEFHDTRLNEFVLNARHAVSIDERRQSFTPTLWTFVEDRADTVRQIWFPGVHGDIGGGQGSCGLSDIALRWMADEALGCGLAFRDSALAQIGEGDHHGYLHDSVKGVFRALKTRPRNVPNFRDPADRAAFHPAALRRAEDPPIAQPEYWKGHALDPGQSVRIDVFASERWNSTGIFMEPGQIFTFSAAGAWQDGSVTSGPGGTADGNFQLAELLQVGGTLLGKAERAFKNISRRDAADFWFTKREEDYPWFSLVGVVANGALLSDQNKEIPHEAFLIGDGISGFSPVRRGYLYAFANDAWQAYGNNRGSVRMEVTRLS